MTRWRYRNWTLRECSAGAPHGCPNTPGIKSVSSARLRHATSPSSSGALPGARTSGRNGPADQVDDLHTELDRDPTCTFWG